MKWPGLLNKDTGEEWTYHNAPTFYLQNIAAGYRPKGVVPGTDAEPGFSLDVRQMLAAKVLQERGQ